MSSSKSINRNPDRKRVALFGVALLCVVSAGCRKQEVKAPPTPRPVYVRLASVLAVHPLQAEVDRLAQDEARLRRLLLTMEGGEENTRFSLPPLPSNHWSGDSENSLRSRQQRHADQLRKLAQQERNAFLERYRQRQRRLAEQQETELRGRLIAEDAEIEHAERERIYQEIIDQLSKSANGQDPLTVRAAIINSRLAVLLAQLVNPEIPLAVLNDKDQPVFGAEADTIVKQEIGQLEKDPKIKGISQRARLELRQQTQEANLQDLTTAMEQIRKDGEARIAAVARDAEAKREQQITEMRNRVESDPRLPDRLIQQEQAITRAVSFDQASVENSLNAIAMNQNHTGSVEIDTLLGGAAPIPIMKTSLIQAIDRIAAQRRRLTTIIETSVRASIGDIAEAQDLNVRIVTGTTPVAETEKIKQIGRTDATALFIKAIQTGIRL